MLVVEPNEVPYDTTPTITRASIGTYITSGGTMATAAIDAVRYTYNPSTLAYEGMLLEPERTNRFASSASLSGSVVVSGLVSGQTYTISFYGSGTVTWSSETQSLVGTSGSFPANRVSKTLVATGTSMTFSASGTVTYAQIELGSFPTSYISTTGTVQTRSADVVSPAYTTKSRILYTSVSETTSVWSSATTYALNEYVMYQGRGYKSLQAANTNNNPITATTWWQDIGVGRVYSPFDTSPSTMAASSLGGSISYVIDGPCNYVGLFGITYNSTYPINVEINVRNTTTGATYSNKVTLTSVKDTQVAFSDIPNIGNLTSFRISPVTPSGGIVFLGNAVAGSATDIGSTQYGATAGIIDYSKKTADDFGNITLVQRAFSKRLSAKVLVPVANLNTVQKLLYSLRAKPAVWSASENDNFKEALVVYGFYRDFSTDIAYPSHSICNLEIEGLV